MRRSFLALLGLTLAIPLGFVPLHAGQAVTLTPSDAVELAARSELERAGKLTATATISGRVTAAGTGVPLSAVVIRLVSAGVPGRSYIAGGGITITNEQGEFRLLKVAAGRYSVVAQRDGYLPSEYGQRQPGDLSRFVDVRDDDRITGVDITLSAGSVVSVRVTDDLGQALAGARVRLLRMTVAPGGRRTLVASDGVLSGPVLPRTGYPPTNDLGDVRIPDVTPGHYYLLAEPDVERGAPIGTTESQRMFLPTLYPGTISVEEAQLVTVAAGHDLSLTMSLAVVPTARITGSVRLSTGQLASTTVVGLRRIASVYSPSVPNVDLRGDASFVLPDVPRGEYRMIVRGRSADHEEIAEAPLTVDGQDISNLVVTTAKGATVRGRFVFEGGEPPSDFQFGGLRAAVSNEFGDFISYRDREEGTFVLEGVVGNGALRLNGLPDGWVTKAIIIDGRNVVDTLTDFSSRELFEKVQAIAAPASELSGTVVDGRNAVPTRCAVVIFPEERHSWTSTRGVIATSRVDQRGQFQIPRLPGGEYRVVAVDDLADASEYDPDVLDRLSPRATRLTIRDGEKKRVSLRLVQIAP